jgi:hypothetical protein
VKKSLIIILGLFFINSSSLAEIVFNNCDLSPNYGKVSMIVNLEKKQLKLIDNFGVSKVLQINEKERTILSVNDNTNEQIDGFFLIDIKTGVIRVDVKPSENSNQATVDLLKNKKNTIDTICEPKNLYPKKEQQKQGILINAEFENKILKAQKNCQRSEYKTKDEIMGCIKYMIAKQEERLLSENLRKEENLKLETEYVSSTGEKITKDSKWKNFWHGAAWILHEHGEDIFKLIVDLKYNTNYSCYNNQAVSGNQRMRCTGQRVGDVIYENCRGGGVRIKCTTTILGSIAQRRCRQL